MSSEAKTGPNTLTKRPTTPRKSSNLPREADNTVPPLPDIHNPKNRDKEDKNKENQAPRRSSLGFLRRSKSSDPNRNRPPIPAAPPVLPDLFGGAGASRPSQTFGDNVDVRDSVAIVSGKLGGLNVPSQSAYSARKSADTGRGTTATSYQESIENMAGSMANRGRYSYASTAVSAVNSPRRVRRRRDPTPFNILLVGARGSGKTSFLQFLQHSLASKSKSAYPEATTPNGTGTTTPLVFEPTTGGTFTKTFLETEIDGERIGLTLWDSVSLENSVVDLQLREISAFIESKFEETFNEETKVVRAPGVQDTHIHCVIHLLDPSRLDQTLKKRAGELTAKLNGNAAAAPATPDTCLDNDLDLQVFRTLQGKTTVLPVISKADTCTTKHMALLKTLVHNSIRRAGLNPLEALDLESLGSEPASPPPPSRGGRSTSGRHAIREEDSDSEDIHVEEDRVIEPDDTSRPSTPPATNTHRRNSSRLSTASLDSLTALSSLIPLSIISPDSYEDRIGREFPWGFADPFDPNHCDFGKLKEAVFSEWRAELRELSREVWYENWRTSRLGGR